MSRTVEQYTDAVFSFIARELLDGQDEDLKTDTPLLEIGVLDSFNTIRLLSFVEKEFGISIPMENIAPGDFSDIASFVELLVRHTSDADT